MLKFASLLMLVVAAPLPSLAAQARPTPVDQTVFLDQQTILNAGGFPFKITAPGSYKLLGNLAVPVNTDGILIQANDVTLDLNGFGITGGIVCDNQGFACAPTPTRDTTGIEAILSATANIFGVTIRNGHVRGFSLGISTFGGIVEQINAAGNFKSGITGSSALIRKNDASRNHGDGIECNSCLVTENIAAFNQGNQFLVGFGGLLSNNAAITSSSLGINNFGALSAGNNACNGTLC